MSDFSSLTDYASSLVSNAKSSNQATTLSNGLKGISKDSTDDELLSACKQFEAYLWEQIYKEVDKSVNIFGTESDGSYAGNMMSTFSDSFIQEIAQQSTGDGSNSLAQTLYEQLKRNYGIGVVTSDQLNAEEISETAAENGVVEVSEE